MAKPAKDQDRTKSAERSYALRFTPAEWRRVIEDIGFLRQQDNSYRPPRRFMGLAVQIVPDHDFG